MTSPEPDITVTLTAREARALIGAASLFGEVWEQLRDEDDLASEIASGGVVPIQSAAMKLEMALVQAQVAP